MITLVLDDDECRLIREALLSLCSDHGPNEHERLLDKIDAIAGTKTVSRFAPVDIVDRLPRQRPPSEWHDWLNPKKDNNPK